MINITEIYLITNIDNNPNKVYIGKSQDSKRRKSSHKRRFGFQITFDIIDSINSLERKYWKPLECKWINYYKDLGYEVINKNEGGNGVDYHTEQTKIKLSKPKSEEWKQKMRGVRGPQPNMKVSKNNGKKVSEALKGKPKPSRYKPVIQYDMCGNLIKKWNSIKEVGEILNLDRGAISATCSGRQKTAYGYKWKYNKNYTFNIY
jgi:hypothetical protein